MKNITFEGETFEISDESAEAFRKQFMKKKKDRPKIGEVCYSLNSGGGKQSGPWRQDGFDEARLKLGNCFWGDEAEKAAEMYKLRLEAMANVWVPEEEEKYWSWDWEEKKSIDRDWDGDGLDLEALFIGNVHKTEEESRAWGAKFNDAFMYKYNSNKNG